jgi:hypothetical protein
METQNARRARICEIPLGGDHNFSTRVYEVEGRSIKGSDLLVNLQI